MDSDRFDELSKEFARPRSRRETLGLFGAAVAGLVFGKSATAAPKADKPSKCYGGNSSCTNAKQCCSGICTNRRCEPEIPPECMVNADCAGTECQAAICTAGVCGTENLATGVGCSAGVCNGSGQCVQCLSDTDCLSGPNSSSACVSGVCGPQICSAGSGDCNNDPADGCETNLLADVNNCGTCGNHCSYPNATGTCVSGNCQLQSCNQGWRDCDGISANGCETNVASDPRNCGVCGHFCPTGPNSSPICSQGTCDQICFSGFKNCDGNLFNGCECPPTGECRGNACCISNGAPAHGSIPCCGVELFGTCLG